MTGCDAGVYPPMSDQLQAAGIDLIEGYDDAQLKLGADLYVIGNAMSRGNPLVEAILNAGLPYTSGPQYLREHLLQDKWVMAVAGTHGKTTTSSMLAWVLQQAGFDPGYLIGGVPQNFGRSARLGGSDFFVIEADEYDTAFFDKRSKFVHYRPNTLILNNLEFDHADIFDDLAAIQKQFHHLLRTVPQVGAVIWPQQDGALADVVAQGCWSDQQILGDHTGADWHWQLASADGSEFDVFHQGLVCGRVRWSQTGIHNVNNALAVIAASYTIGISPDVAIDALCTFSGVKRRHGARR